VKCRLIKIEQALHEKGIIVEHAVNGGLPVTIAAQQTAIVPAHGRKDKVRGAARSFGITRVSENGPGLCERRNHEPVPRGQNLVVPVRTRSSLPSLKKNPLGFLQSRICPFNIHPEMLRDLLYRMGLK